MFSSTSSQFWVRGPIRRLTGWHVGSSGSRSGPTPGSRLTLRSARALRVGSIAIGSSGRDEHCDSRLAIHTRVRLSCSGRSGRRHILRHQRGRSTLNPAFRSFELVSCRRGYCACYAPRRTRCTRKTVLRKWNPGGGMRCWRGGCGLR
jgi:hypothetical protein